MQLLRSLNIYQNLNLQFPLARIQFQTPHVKESEKRKNKIGQQKKLPEKAVKPEFGVIRKTQKEIVEITSQNCLNEIKYESDKHG